MTVEVHVGDSLEVLEALPDRRFDLVYLDCARTRVRSGSDWDSLGPQVAHASRLLTSHGSVFLRADVDRVHELKVLLDGLFGRQAFKNEIVFARPTRSKPSCRWPAGHDTVLWYAPGTGYYFDYDAIDRIPYMAPGLVGREKAARGKTPTDVWWHSQAPEDGFWARLIRVHTRPNDAVLVVCASSGDLAVSAAKSGRHCVQIASPNDVRMLAKRLEFANPSIIALDRVSDFREH